MKHFSWIVLLMFVVGASVRASEGVVLIDQDTALKGKLQGDEPGFPVTISTPGSYRLASNLTVTASDTDAIQIFSDNVTLDLNGFTISGSWTPGAFYLGTGVYSPSARITVRNGVVTGFPQGIFLTGASAVVEGVTLANNDYGLDTWGDSAFVNRVTARNNTTGGIVLFGSGMVMNSLTTHNAYGIYIGIRGGYGGSTSINNIVDVQGGTSMGSNVCTAGAC